MKTLVTYATNHGATAAAAETLGQAIGGDVTVLDIKDDPKHDISAYDTVLLGGSIHAGNIQRRVRKFCESNKTALLGKRLGLFVSCMYEGDKARQQFDAAYPSSLRTHASAEGFFGGILNWEKMNFIERTIVKKVEGVSHTVDKMDHEAIAAFARAISQ